MSCLGIICALTFEGRCLTGNRIPDNTVVQINDRAIAIVCGMGEDNARHAAQLLLDQNINSLISWGTAGSLTEHVHSGDLILADSVVRENGENYSFDAKWNRQLATSLGDTNLKIHHGNIAHAEKILTTPKDKSDLHETTGALAVDMESLVIAMIAHKEKIPCLSIRAIIDEASQNIPDAIIKHTDNYGRPALLPLFAALVKQPGLLSTLINLDKSMKAATHSLSTVARNQTLFTGIHS